MQSWLVISLLAPLVGAITVVAVGRVAPSLARTIAAIASVVTLALAAASVWAALRNDPVELTFVNVPWLSADRGIDLSVHLGLDGLSLWLFGLSALLSLTAVLVSWEAIHDRPVAYYSLLLVLEAGMMGVFAARDVILFYLFFEFTLIPLFFLIGIWGSEERRYAAVKFFLYTFAGSVLTFLGLLALVIVVGRSTPGGNWTFSIPELTRLVGERPLDPAVQWWIFLALFAGFAIKVPLFPVHTWLPLAHVQAPTAGSVLLAGILLKIGTYGFVRFSMTLLPAAAAACMSWILWLSVIGILYGALVALAQTDMKRLIAYSSVSHLGFCMLGLFAFNRLGVQGGTLQMINHGLSTGGLFAVVGMLYERYHSREIRDFSGIAARLPILATFMVILTFSSIGLPGLNGFVGEFLILIGMFQRAWLEAPAAWTWQMLTISVLALSGVVLGAWYMLWLVARVFFGPLREPGGHSHHAVRDLSAREIAALAPLVVLIFWIGLFPQHFLRPMRHSLDLTTARVSRAAAVTLVAGDEQHPPLVANR